MQNFCKFQMNMKNTKYINLIVLIMLFIEFTLARPTKSKKRKSCGKELANRISFVCENLGGYNPYSANPNGKYDTNNTQIY